MSSFFLCACERHFRHFLLYHARYVHVSNMKTAQTCRAQTRLFQSPGAKLGPQKGPRAESASHKGTFTHPHTQNAFWTYSMSHQIQSHLKQDSKELLPVLTQGATSMGTHFRLAFESWSEKVTRHDPIGRQKVISVFTIRHQVSFTLYIAGRARLSTD